MDYDEEIADKWAAASVVALLILGVILSVAALVNWVLP